MIVPQTRVVAAEEVKVLRDSEYILKVEATRFADGLGIEYERNRGVKNDSKVFA